MFTKFKKLGRSHSSRAISKSTDSFLDEEDDSMPSRDLTKSPANYPPCNRAFALRMMNPTAYSDYNVSPLDQEIKPLPKRTLAKKVSLNGADSDGGSVSFDDSSIGLDNNTLSPSSSVASLQDMELYDIDEDGNSEAGEFTLNRTKSMVDTFKRGKNATPKANGYVNGEYSMARSYTAVESFDNVSNFSRGSSHRATLPAKLMSKGKQNASAANGNSPGVNGKRKEAGNTVNKNESRSTPSRNEKSATKPSTRTSLNRTQSMRERPRSALSSTPTSATRMTSKDRPASANPLSSRNNTPDARNRTATSRTKSSDPRSKTPDIRPKSTDLRNNRLTKSASKVSPKGDRHRASGSDPSESDSSTVFSEADAYLPKNNPRRPHSNSHLGVNSTHMNGGNSYDASLDSSADHFTRVRSRTAPAFSSSPLPHANVSDQFGEKLAEVCHLMSEKHPGEFQILETLVDMQAAYEAKEQHHRNNLASLQAKVDELERRLERSERRKAPNVSTMILPLAKATTMFQKQLEEIMLACANETAQSGVDIGVQANAVEIPCSHDDISNEANAVAERISQIVIEAEHLANEAALREQEEQSADSSRLNSSNRYDSDSTLKDEIGVCNDSQIHSEASHILLNGDVDKHTKSMLIQQYSPRRMHEGTIVTDI